MDNIYNLFTQHTNSENIVFAVDRAAKVVFALKTYTHHNASSDLGLDIVRKIIENHAGRIDVASRPGRTTFQVWLPIREY